jgi:hypothetical protein
MEVGNRKLDGNYKEEMARSSREEPPKTSAYKGWEKLLI